MKLLYNLEHLLYTIVVGIIGFYFNNPIYFSLLAISFFVGREHTQAEYRWIETFGRGVRANMPWWATLDIRVWDFHSWFWNLLLPIGYVIGLSVVVSLI